MKMTKLAAFALAAVLMCSGCAGSAGKTAIKVGDSAVTEGGIKFYAEQGMMNPDVEEAAKSMKETYLVMELAKKMNIAISEEEEKQIKSSIANFKSSNGGKKQADEMLKGYGVSDEDLRKIIGVSAYQSAILQQLEIADPTDEEAEQFFKDNYLRAKHVLVMTTDPTTGAELDEAAKAEAKKKAEDILAQAQGGADFNALVTEFGEDPGMESNPDGYVFTDGDMVKEFEDMTKSLQPGEIGMCETSYGYHVIQRLALDETPELYQSFLEDNKSAARRAAKSKKQEDALMAKADELGIKVDENEEVISAIQLDEPKEDEEN